MKKINVAYVYDVYPMPYAPYIDLLNEHLSKQDIINPSIYAFNTNKDGIYSLKYNLHKRIQHKLHSRFTAKKTPLFLQELIKNKPDIVHIQLSYIYWKFLPLFDDAITRKKIVITLRGGDTYIKPWISKEWLLFYKKYGELIHFVTMSTHQRQYLIQWGVPAERVFVIPISHNNKTEIDHSAKAGSDILKIASVYRMTWEKNLQGSLLFIKKLTDKGIKVQYDIFGDGDGMGEVYFLVDRLGLKDSVHIKGKVPYKELMTGLKEYHFVLQLSISEALPSSILEAQSLGIPAIISDSGGLPEAVVVNESAVCRPFWEIDELVGDTIAVWQDKKKYQSFCKRSFEHSKNFTVDKEVERLVSMYTEILT